MPDHGGDEIERLAHLRQHCRDRPPQIMRVELFDRRLVAARQEEVSDSGRRQDGPNFGLKQWSLVSAQEPGRNDLSGFANERRDARLFVFRALDGQRPIPLLTVNLLNAKTADFATSRTG
jgi:hypothetical protein